MVSKVRGQVDFASGRLADQRICSAPMSSVKGAMGSYQAWMQDCRLNICEGVRLAETILQQSAGFLTPKKYPKKNLRAPLNSAIGILGALHRKFGGLLYVLPVAGDYTAAAPLTRRGDRAVGDAADQDRVDRIAFLSPARQVQF